MQHEISPLMSTLFPYIKAFHILFVASWFAGLFYIPRIFVNLAEETNPAATERLIGMAQRLYRFSGILMIPAIVLGMILWIYYGIGRGPGSGWMHAKLALIVFLIGYHHSLAIILTKFKEGRNQRSHVWYRWFNEIPVVVFAIIAILVVGKFF
ncbi:CopD family protein [Polynucleobacter sp. MWH-Loch1C5]|uniref:CopD family protein n=1 Tax=Polynucleobacter sp. MWH-Loch1C5 TaxID=2689108 RepID=UPI0021076293|nr:CopD family protein [Polynucleobacter sp. MWH-Loch1C5]